MSATANDPAPAVTAAAAAAAGAAAANKPAGKPSKLRSKKSVGGSAKPPAAASTPAPSSPTGATHSGAPADGTSESSKAEKIEMELLKDVSKRLKRHAKKLESIKRSEDKLKGLSPEEMESNEVLKGDERRKLNDKPIIEAVHRELQGVHERLATLAQAEARLVEDRLAEQKRFYETKIAESVRQAQEEARCQVRDDMFALGNEKVNTLLKFLRLAGYRRSVRSENVQEDEAIEQVLVLVYSGDSAAMDACVKLAEGSLDPVGEEHVVSFARVKQLAHDLHLDDEEDVQDEVDGGVNGGGPSVGASPDEVPASPQSSTLTMNGEAPEAGANPAIAGGAAGGDAAGGSAAAATAAATATTGATTTAPATTATAPITTTTTASTSPTPTPTSPTFSSPADPNPAAPLAPVDSGELANGWVKVQDETPLTGEGRVLAESTGNALPAAPAAAEPKGSGEPGEAAFHDVERRRGGRGGGRGHRGRGGNEFRRSRGGFRGDRGGGEEHHHRGEHHHHRGGGEEHHHRRGSGEHHHRGNGEHHRGGGEHNHRGNGEHHRGGGEHHHRGGGEHHRGGGEQHHRGGGEHHHRGGGEHHRGGGGGEHHRRGGGRGRSFARRGGSRGEFRGRGDHQQAPPAAAEVASS